MLRRWQFMKILILSLMSMMLVSCSSVNASSNSQAGGKLLAYMDIEEVFEEPNALALAKSASKGSVKEIEKLILKKDTLLNEISERVLNLNHLDLMLFNQAEKLIHEKMLFLKKYSPRQWVYNYATINSNQVLSGAAFTSTQEPVELILKENGQEVSRFVANDFFNSFPNLVFPRGRYVGFRVPLKSKDENSFFSLEVTLTRQVIFYGKIES